MSFLNWFKSLFNKKNIHVCEDTIVILKRRGYDITLPLSVYNDLLSKNYTIGLITAGKGDNVKPSCVQVKHTENGKPVYIGTLKSLLGVKKFKDGNVCNFNNNNVVKE